MPGFDDLQKDPVAALTKGFGWFTTTVGKTAKTVNEGYIQPTAAKVPFLSPRSPPHLIFEFP
jgi:ADP-ribosylation factor GTPase-activating protein 1